MKRRRIGDGIGSHGRGDVVMVDTVEKKIQGNLRLIIAFVFNQRNSEGNRNRLNSIFILLNRQYALWTMRGDTIVQVLLHSESWALITSKMTTSS